MKVVQPKKPKICEWISDNTWNNFKIKEKDYIIMLYKRKFTEEKIQRNLYIFDRSHFSSFKKKIREKLKSDILSFNNH